MTTQEFDALEDRAVDALIAEKVMGWIKTHGMFPNDFLYPPYMRPEYNIAQHSDGTQIPKYSTDLNACRDIEQHFFDWATHCSAYGISLLMVLGLANRQPLGGHISWDIANATARQKCKAALMAVGIIEASGKEDVR